MIKPAESFLTSTLREYPWGIKITRILAASLAAVDPAAAIDRALQRNGNILSVAGQEIKLEDFKNVYLLAIGKAGIPMAVAAGDLVSDHLSGGAVLSKSTDPGIPDDYQEKIKLYQGDHPIPDQKSLKSTEEILSLFSSQTSNDLIIVLISGGGSALFTSPQTGISLKDLQQANKIFLERGLNIQEINTIRKHISQIKGGQLAGHLYPARTISVILSDVIGDPIDMIASGPTVPDPSTYDDALA
ncbi:MAG: glycerate-2-kinase family protein, partial [Anaerolineales bacterium]|nr:glycerate-2-kinase family protein [Anaerolineales bacterium]